MEANIDNVKVGMKLKCVLRLWDEFTVGKLYDVERVGECVLLTNDNGNTACLLGYLDHFEIVEDKTVFKSGDKVRITRASLPYYWYADKIGEVFTLDKPLVGFPSTWVIKQGDDVVVKGVGEEDLELYVEPKKHNDFEDALKSSFSDMADCANGEDKSISLTFLKEREKGGEFTLNADYSNSRFTEGIDYLRKGLGKPAPDSAKELLSIQTYLKETGVVGLEMVIGADSVLVIDTEGVTYECESLVDAYNVVDAVAFLDKKVK